MSAAGKKTSMVNPSWCKLHFQTTTNSYPTKRGRIREPNNGIIFNNISYLYPTHNLQNLLDSSYSFSTSTSISSDLTILRLSLLQNLPIFYLHAQTTETQFLLCATPTASLISSFTILSCLVLPRIQRSHNNKRAPLYSTNGLSTKHTNLCKS